MRSIKKMAALGLAALMAASAVTGCSAGGDSKSTAGAAAKEENASGEKVKITVWTVNRHDSAYMNQVVEEFNKTNPDIEIEYVIQTENYENLLSMAANSGQSPDVFTAVNQNYVKNFADGGIIQPINQYITEEFRKVNEVDSHLYEGYNVIGEDIYYVPCGKRSGARLIYNKEIFDDLGISIPEKLEDLPAVAKQITEAGNGDYYGIIFPGASSPFERWIEHAAEKSGVTPYDYKNGKFDFTGFKPIIEIIRQMFEENSVFPGSSSIKIDPARVQFAEGHVGIHGNASQEATVLTDQFPAQMEWGVADLPTLGGEIKGAQLCNPNNGYMMSGSTEHPEEAWKVIEYFGSEEVLKGYLESGYTLPLSDYMDSKIDKSKIGRMADFSGADYEAVYPIFPAVTPEGETYRDALWNACLPEGPSIDETIANLNKTYNAALDQEVSMGKTKRLVIRDYDPMHPNDGTPEYLDK